MAAAAAHLIDFKGRRGGKREKKLRADFTRA
jgi:hypothetical protein